MNLRKHYIVLLLCGALMCGMQVLSAESVRIAVVDATTDSPVHPDQMRRYFTSLCDYLERYGELTSWTLSALQRIDDQRLQDYLLRVHTNLHASDGQIDELSSDDTPPTIDSIQVLQPAISTALLTELASRDLRVADFLLRREQLDVLVVIHFAQRESLVRLHIDAYRRDGSADVIFEDIALLQDVHTMLRDSMLPTVRFFSETPLAALTVSDAPSGLRLSVDGHQFGSDALPLILPTGTHTVRAEAPGMQTLTQIISIDTDEVKTVEFAFRSVERFPLLVTSDWKLTTVQAPSEEVHQVPIVLLSQQIPSVLHAYDGEGQMQVYHLTEKQDEVNLSWHPRWVNPVFGTARQQDAVYASLGRSMLLVGLTILSDSLIRSTGANSDLWEPVLYVSGGAAGVSFIDTVFRLFAYYRKTKYSSRYWSNEVPQR